MKIDPSRFTIGDEWVYRQSDDAPSERVRIQAIKPKKNSARLEIRFLDDPNERVENVPGSRLRVPWNEVDAFDTLMANWRRIEDLTLDHTEEACIEEIFLLLIGPDVAEQLYSPVSGATEIHDRVRLSEIIGGPIEEILAAAEWFDHDGRTILSPAGTLQLVEAACRISGDDWPDTGLFFVRPDGKPWHPQTISDRFNHLVATSGLPPVRLHDLRHCAATYLRHGGADLKEIQETLGHSNIAITSDIYTSVLLEFQRTHADTVADLIPRQKPAP